MAIKQSSGCGVCRLSAGKWTAMPWGCSNPMQQDKTKQNSNTKKTWAFTLAVCCSQQWTPFLPRAHMEVLIICSGSCGMDLNTERDSASVNARNLRFCIFPFLGWWWGYSAIKQTNKTQASALTCPQNLSLQDTGQFPPFMLCAFVRTALVFV